MFPAMLWNVQLGTDTVLTHPDLVNLYGCSSHTFICEGVTIEDKT